MARIRIVGAGRAGSSMARALRSVGHEVIGPVGRGFDRSTVATGVDAVIIATSDDSIATVADSFVAGEDVVVLHLSGSLGLDVLSKHPRIAALHPLITLPTVEVGADRLVSGITFAVAGDSMATSLARSLHGHVVEVADRDRPRYHAAACIAANHVVALLGQAERVAASAGLSLDAFVELTRAALDDVAALGPRNALTGPAARGDWATLQRHLDAIDPAEHAAYRAGVGLALELSATPEVELVLEEPVDDVPEVRSPSVVSLVG